MRSLAKSTWLCRLLVLTALIALGCSDRSASSSGAPDASMSAAPVEHAESARAIADLVHTTFASNATLAARFAPNDDGFQHGKDGIVSPGWRGAWTDRAHHVGARLPSSADRAFEAGLGVSELYRVSFAHRGARPSTLSIDAGRGVYREVFPSTDVTFVTSPERMEWAYVLRDEKAPLRFELQMKLPRNLRDVRPDLRGGLQLMTAGGEALLNLPRPIAIDAKGVTRDATLAWDGTRLTVTLDASGLSYPIVLDPAVETAVWEPRVQLPTARYQHAMAYDFARKRAVLFGGQSRPNETWEWDGDVWSLRATSGPSARYSPVMSYDSARGFTVLFGGISDSGGVHQGDTWEWDGSAWFQRCTTSPCSSTTPPPRSGAAMAFDATRNKTVLFGGGWSVDGNDTWTWNGTAWQQITGSVPTARRDGRMTYESSRGTILLFGGSVGSSGSYLNDLWRFDGTNWTSVTATGGPPAARSSAIFVSQNATGKVLLHGGADSVSPYYKNDAWEFTSSTNTWTSVGTGPGARTQHAAVYDSNRGVVTMFGGNDGNPFSDTWEYKGGTWAQAAGKFRDRKFAASSFDAFRNRVVVFGGRTLQPGTLFSDTWEWTGYSWTEVCTTAPCSSTKPLARFGAAMAYDSARRFSVLFGGTIGSVANDTWEFDGNTWAQRCTTAPCNTILPSARSGSTAAFDSTRNRLVLFGGTDTAAEFAGPRDTWEWTGSAWTAVCTAAPCSTTVPGARVLAGMAFDSARNRVVLFGGGNRINADTTYGDTWEYTGSQWIQVATTGPAARFGARLAYDPVRKKTVLFGGMSQWLGTGVTYSDTWEWDGTTWTLTSAGGTSARFGHTLDYDAARRRIVAHGGERYDSNGLTELPDTWEYYSRGGACSVGTQCATGFCVDGVCCEQVTCGSCEACNGSTPGVCSTVTNADDSDTCAAATKTCDAVGACRLKNAQSCSSGSECASGFCADGYCCNTACSGGCDVCNATPGTCTAVAKGGAGSSPSCGAYLCNGTAGTCPSGCTTDGDCASNYFCDAGGTCQLRRAQGNTCNTGTGGDCKAAGCRECSGSLSCKDGFCCGSACTGSCQTCAATPGTCTTVLGGSDPDTCSGTTTCSSTGACLASNGQTCTSSTQCASGNCVDGYCCNTSCAGGCDVCNATPGTCSVLAQGSTGTSCGTYVCNGSSPACPTVCGNDADCAPSAFCSASGTCVARKAQGATCNQATGADCKSSGCRVCSSGNCIDGYCCDTACGSSCDACNGAALGWGGATNGTCAVAPASSAGSPSCGTYACNGTSATCATSCTSDAQCGSGSYCNASGVCVAQKTQGASCNLATDCKVSGTCRACGTGNCVDGVCCNTACGGQCQACDVSGALGSCVTVTGAPHGARAACAGTGACASTCNGVDATSCKYPGSSLACGSLSCAAGAQTNLGTCNGAGACNQTTTPCGTYGCDGSTCKTSCTADTDCASSAYYCVGGACTVKKTNGDTCTGSNACVSGNCVDGVCCSSASCGSGERCNLVASLGKCAKSNGAACTVSTECGSGFCVDGVCCDTGCNAQCAACDVTGKVGTCSAVSGAPHGSRSACAGAGSGTACARVCDGSDISACQFPNTSKSCGANTCTSSGGTYIETHTSVCDGAGGCKDEPKTCVGYTCGGAACKTSCSANTDCATGFYCKTGACVPIEGLGTSCTTATTCTSGFCTDGVCCAVGSCGAGKSCSAGTGTLKGVCVSLNGTACTADAECASGVCADGVCCNSACNGSCEACNKAGSVGTCVPTVGDPLTGHPACSGTSTDSDCAARCDGTDGKNCKYPGTTSVCGKPSCGAGVEVQVSTCDGAGKCKPSSKGCAPYVCGPTACLTSCTKNDDCGTGDYCNKGACEKTLGLGKVCGAGAECASGFCADGVCCSVSTCGEGSSCAAADSTTPGVCLKKKGVACTKADDCATGRCVDGFCCDAACNGQCEACDVGGSEGTCTPVVGAPHGTGRTACDTLDAKDCAKAQCDGKARDKCSGFANGGTTACGMASCTTDKRYQATGACDGAGKCAMPEPKNCTPYACDATASSGCKSACANDDECAADFKCEAGACIQGAKCSDDRSQSIDKTGVAKDCKPYRCGSDGKCATACATSDDCASGTACDPNAKACVIYSVDDSGGDGGCGCTTPGESRNTHALWFAALIGLGALRRRRSTAQRARN